MSGIKISFFVHECVLEAGHTRAMLEVIRSLPPDALSELHLIYYEGSSSKKLLPQFRGKVIHHKVPCKWLFPFLIKSIFYQLWSYFLIRFVLPQDSLKVGIGTACLNVDITNVQFVQTQWESLYFKNSSFFKFRTLYKRILFYYFRLCENYLFRKESIRISSLSQFVTDFLIDNFQVPETKIKTIYSSTNLDHFPLPQRDRDSLFIELKEKYPELQKLDPNKTIYLFVGAYERKGLAHALEKLSTLPNSQLIVIGKPESGKDYRFPNNPKTFPIRFTREIKLFYELSDVFIFPTIYEPFGLVITEAAAMGNIVLVPKNNVGASEILDSLESVIFLDQEHINLNELSPLSLKQKQNYSKKVRERLSFHSWEKASQDFYHFIKE